MIFNSRKQKGITLILAGCVLGVAVGGVFEIIKRYDNNTRNNIELASQKENSDNLSEVKATENSTKDIVKAPIIQEDVEVKTNQDMKVNREIQNKPHNEVVNKKLANEVKVINTKANVETKGEKTKGIIYKNENFGISLELPESWRGKYRISETDDKISVYTIPHESNNVDSGLLFFLIKRPNDDLDFNKVCIDQISLDLPRVRKINGNYIYAGRTTGVMMDDKDANYNLYMDMANQCADIVRNMKEIEVPKTDKQDGIIYNNENFGISLKLPESWRGKYRISETDDKISVYTIPHDSNYLDAGLLFFILKRPNDDLDIDKEFIDLISDDLPRVRKINGSYIYAGRTTGVMLDNKDANYNLYMEMASQCADIVRNMQEIK